MAEQPPSLETAQAEFSHPNNITVGKGRVLWGNEISKDGKVIAGAGWVLPGGRRTLWKEEAERVASVLNTFAR